MRKVGTATLIRFTDDQLTALDSLSAKSGHSLAALVRWCLDFGLPELRKNIDASLKAKGQ